MSERTPHQKAEDALDALDFINHPFSRASDVLRAFTAASRAVLMAMRTEPPKPPVIPAHR